MTIIGYDYTARIAPAALKAAGCSVAFRYTMPQTPYWVKALRNAEAEELLAAGIPIVSNFESSAQRMLGGAQAGHDDAVTQLADWRALSAPPGLKCFYSADWDVQPSEVAAVLAYLSAAASVHGGGEFVGCYGGLRAVRAAADAGFTIWQAEAWSGGAWDTRAVARQVGGQRTIGGVQVDVNQIINLAALGAWGGPTPAGGSTVPNIPASIAQNIPDVAAQFPPNGTFDTDTALIWADARAAAAMLYAKQARDEVTAVKAELDGVNGKLDQVLSKLGTLSAGGVDVGVLASDVVRGMGQKLAGA